MQRVASEALKWWTIAEAPRRDVSRLRSARKCQRRRAGSLTPFKIDYVEINELGQARQRPNRPKARGATRRRTAKPRGLGLPRNQEDDAERCDAGKRAAAAGEALASMMPALASCARFDRLELDEVQQRDDTRTVTAADRRYRAARGIDIDRYDALASSGLTGRPPAMYANVRHGPMARGPSVSGPNDRASFSPVPFALCFASLARGGAGSVRCSARANRKLRGHAPPSLDARSDRSLGARGDAEGRSALKALERDAVSGV
jgi:hypothetical protein